MEQATGPKFDARDWYRIIRKRIWLVVAAVVLTVLAGVVMALAGKTEYVATAQVAIKQAPKGMVWLTDNRPPEQTRPTISLETQREFAQSRLCAVKARRILSNPSPDPLGGAKPPVYYLDERDILDSVSVTVAPPEMLIIQARRDNADEAVAVANALARGFEEFYNENQRRDITSAVTYLTEQLEQTREQLDAADAAASSFQRQTGIIASDAGTGYIVNALDTFRAERARAQAELAEARAAVARLESIVAREPNARVEQVPSVNPERVALAEALANDQMALTTLRAQFTDQHPAVQSMLARVRGTQERLAQLPPVITEYQVQPNAKLATAALELEAQRTRVRQREAQIASYDRDIAQLRQEAKGLLTKEGKFGRLVDEKQLAREQHKAVLQQLSAKQLEEATVSRGDVMIAEAVSAKKVGPRLLSWVLFACLLGIFLGVAGALVQEALDDRIYTAEDIERYTTVPFLGLIPYSESDQPVAISAPKSPPAEAYRQLRSNIMFAIGDAPASVFLVSSAGSGEGKTSVVANFAVSLAQAGSSVIVLDADLRRPTLHRAFGLGLTPGLTNVLVREMFVESVLQDTEVPNLRVVPAGPMPPNPAELLASPRMERVIGELSERADIVIIDTPPCVGLADANILASKADHVILVAEAGRVRRDHFNEAVRLMQHHRGAILGAVLNKLRFVAGDYYSYYYYYYYGSDRPSTQPVAQPAQDRAEAERAELQERPTLPWERAEWLPEDEATRPQEPPQASAPAPRRRGRTQAAEPPPAAPLEPTREQAPGRSVFPWERSEPPAAEGGDQTRADDSEPSPPALPWDAPRRG